MQNHLHKWLILTSTSTTYNDSMSFALSLSLLKCNQRKFLLLVHNHIIILNFPQRTYMDCCNFPVSNFVAILLQKVENTPCRERERGHKNRTWGYMIKPLHVVVQSSLLLMDEWLLSLVRWLILAAYMHIGWVISWALHEKKRAQCSQGQPADYSHFRQFSLLLDAAGKSSLAALHSLPLRVRPFDGRLLNLQSHTPTSPPVFF
uniref:Uncharacterized protein n=1 Tax=Nelumbo nucifera TaxID=4432 RepID=A0A822ZIX1_NELNU|nr:TPA_asm: hypothetical protein HUJ06_004274 [Nelumbo nucifera]